MKKQKRRINGGNFSKKARNKKGGCARAMELFSRGPGESRPCMLVPMFLCSHQRSSFCGYPYRLGVRRRRSRFPRLPCHQSTGESRRALPIMGNGGPAFHSCKHRGSPSLNARMCKLPRAEMSRVKTFLSLQTTRLHEFFRQLWYHPLPLLLPPSSQLPLLLLLPQADARISTVSLA